MKPFSNSLPPHGSAAPYPCLYRCRTKQDSAKCLKCHRLFFSYFYTDLNALQDVTRLLLHPNLWKLQFKKRGRKSCLTLPLNVSQLKTREPVPAFQMSARLLIKKTWLRCLYSSHAVWSHFQIFLIFPFFHGLAVSVNQFTAPSHLQFHHKNSHMPPDISIFNTGFSSSPLLPPF